MAKPSNNGLTGLSVGLLVSLLLLVGFILASKLFPKKNSQSYAAMRNQIQTGLESRGVHPSVAKILTAVSALETGFWTSNLMKKVNNLWGMKHPTTRSSTSTGPTSSGFAAYNDLDGALDDMRLYLTYFRYPNQATLTEFAQTMKNKGYFTEDLGSYLPALQNVFKRLYG